MSAYKRALVKGDQVIKTICYQNHMTAGVRAVIRTQLWDNHFRALMLTKESA